MLRVVSKGSGVIQSTLILIPHQQGALIAPRITDHVETDNKIIRFAIESERDKVRDNFIFGRGPYLLRAAYNDGTRTFHVEQQTKEEE
jgi:hypothetical protein